MHTYNRKVFFPRPIFIMKTVVLCIMIFFFFSLKQCIRQSLMTTNANNKVNGVDSRFEIKKTLPSPSQCIRAVYTTAHYITHTWYQPPCLFSLFNLHTSMFGCSHSFFFFLIWNNKKVKLHAVYSWLKLLKYMVHKFKRFCIELHLRNRKS